MALATTTRRPQPGSLALPPLADQGGVPGPVAPPPGSLGAPQAVGVQAGQGGAAAAPGSFSGTMAMPNVGAAPAASYQTQGDLTGKVFTGTAPKATPYGDFIAPGPGLSDYGQYRIDQGQKALQRSAAARGTLLTGGLQNRLQQEAQRIASEEAGNDFTRALSAYTTNRDTNQQNFGQSTTQFRGDLDIFGANNANALAWARENRDAAAATADGMSGTSGGSYAPAPYQGSYASDYANAVAATRAQNAAQEEMLRRPLAQTPTPWAKPIQRGGVA